MILVGVSGKKYEIEQKPFSSGGEGDIYAILGVDNQVIKVYKKDRVTRELENKINLMVRRPPSSNVLNQVAWPLDSVHDSAGVFCGFVMTKLDITDELSDIYVYPPKSGITYQQKLVLAQNICAVIHEVHRAGYVFGDFNPRNIGINVNTGVVAFLDTDSYHIVLEKNINQAYRCNVCAPGYVAPELLEKCSYHISAHPEDKQSVYAKIPLDTFTLETDNFALAIHMFRLLMNGYTPFNGINENESVSMGSPGVGDVAVKRDSYCFKPGNKPLAAAVPDISVLPNDVASLFTRAFIDGRKDPKKRPNAIEWHKALENYEKSLITCSVNRTHMYKRGMAYCPWCEADSKYSMSMTPKLKQKSFVSPVMPIAASQARNLQSAASQVMTSTQLNTFTSNTPVNNGNVSGTLRTANSSKSVIRNFIMLTVVAVVIFVGVRFIFNSADDHISKIYETNNIEETNNVEQLYSEAESFFENGKYSEAAEIYRNLKESGEYKYSDERINEIYRIGIQLYEDSDFDGAERIFESLGDYENATDYLEYILADKAYNNGDLASAEIKYCNIDDSDAISKGNGIWEDVIRSRRRPVTVNRTDNDGSYIFAITNDGRVSVASDGSKGDGKCDVSEWTNIVQVSASAWHTVGLKEDGTVVAVGRDDGRRCDVSSWKNIVQISAAADYTAALTKDGKVLTSDERWMDTLSTWNSIVEISASNSHIIGLRNDGKVLAVGESGKSYCAVDKWEDIKSVCAVYMLSIGVRTDGTVVTVGNNYGFSFDEEKINNEWNNVIFCEGSNGNHVGLRNDGCLIQDVDNNNDFFFTNIREWDDIVYMSEGLHILIAVKSDGTILSTGTRKRTLEIDTSTLNNIRTVDVIY